MVSEDDSKLRDSNQPIDYERLHIPVDWVPVQYYDAYNILFRIENTLRLLLFVVLKSHYRDEWENIQIADEVNPGTIRALAKIRREAAQDFGHLGSPSNNPLLFLNGGEIVRLITSEKYWQYFQECFPANRKNTQLKLFEILSIRNDMAHFRAINREHLVTLKNNINQVLKKAGDYLAGVVCYGLIGQPTSITQEWSADLERMSQGNVHLTIFPGSEGWLTIKLYYRQPITTITELSNSDKLVMFKRLESLSILEHYKGITNNIVSMQETVEAEMDEDDHLYFDDYIDAELMFTAHVRTINKHAEEFVSEVKRLVANILSEESGKNATGEKTVLSVGTILWSDGLNSLWNDIAKKAIESRFPEYWGDYFGKKAYVPENFIMRTRYFPWFAKTITQRDNP
ncbi:MAG TPA: hypothetical protein PK263_04970 [bacterium]|nr:hypothetical protein [bacterium]